MKLISITVFFACSISSLLAIEPTEKFDRQSVLNNVNLNNSYILYWNVVNDVITFELHVGTLGWIGLGFSPNGGMAGSNIVIAGVRNKQPYLYNCFATAESMPICDEHSNYNILYGAENETHTVVKFSRKLSPCDGKDWKITNDTVRLIWAYNPEDAESFTNFKKHTEKGHKSVLFLEQGKESRAKFPVDVTTYDLNVTNVSIPSNVNTLYLCKIFKMPKKPKHHIIKYEVLITPGNENYLHHIVVFHCLYDMEKYVDKQEPCFNEDHTRGSEMYKCTSRYLAGWGIGAEAVVFPDNLGYPIFEEGRSPYLMVEFHYNNPNFLPNLVDNSGIRFYVTPTLRQQEIGSIITGTGFDNNSIILPPGQKQITLAHNCDSKCTQWLPKSGIKILGVFLHQHMQGKALRLRHFRDGVELPTIAEDNFYDFNFQEQRYFPNPRVVLPNDTLRIECEWQTVNRKNVTFGGYSSSEEMCLIFIDYYPRTENLLSCMGGPSQETFAEGLGAKILSESHGTSPVVLEGLDGKNVTLAYYATAINWTEDKANSDPLKLRTTRMEKLQQNINSGLYFQYCAKRLDPNNTKDPAFGDFMGNVAGQTVFNKNGVKLMEKLEEFFYPPQRFEEPKVLFKVPDLCGINSTTASPTFTTNSTIVANFSQLPIDENGTVFGNGSNLASSNQTKPPTTVRIETGPNGANKLAFNMFWFLFVFCSLNAICVIFI